MRKRRLKRLARGGVLTPEEYAELAAEVGTHQEAGEALGIHQDTVRKRGKGHPRYPINREATVALLAVAGRWLA